MIIDNTKYSEILGDLTYTKVLGSSAPRGRILDRNYNVIVDNKAINSIVQALYIKKIKILLLRK